MMKKKIKLGLLLDSNRKLQDWENKLLSSIINSKFCEIKAIFYEPSQTIKKNYFTKNIFSSFLNLIIKLIEKRFENKKNRKKIFLNPYPKYLFMQKKKSILIILISRMLKR